MFRSIQLSLAALLLAVGGFASRGAAADAVSLDAWKHLPVLFDGRIMPLQTFARKAVSDITGRQNPKLDPKHELGAERFESDDLAQARKLFPGGAARKWEASELLLSWMVEPEAWEEVPFLLAEHESLRKLLGLKVEDDRGHLRYVSPAQVMDSDEFFARVRKLGEEQKAAQAAGLEFKPRGEDARVAELAQAFRQYRQLTTNTVTNLRARGRFMAKAAQAVRAWSTVYEILGVFHQRQGDLSELSQTIDKADAAHQAIVDVLKRGGDFEVRAIEPAVIDFADAAKALQKQTAALKRRLISNPPEGFSAEQLERLQGTMTLLASKGRAMAKYARAMHLALYDDNYPLRVAPALNAAALERDRDTTKDDAQPWLALQTVLHGSDELLQDYPQGPLNEVRAAYGELVAAYRKRDAADRPARVERASVDLAHALRALGEEVEPLREKLPIRHPDDALMAFTQYPPVGYTDTEVAYNELDPFKWGWVLSLLATFCFALAFGVMRKPMFWLGAAVLLGGLLWTVFSFYLRVSITRWAPVTNMYETVVYVPFVVSLLGAWFLLLPLTWPGLKAAWRLSAIPGTWEATGGGEGEKGRGGEKIAHSLPLNLVFVAARVGLMAVAFYYLSFAKIYDGGSTVLSLTPQSPVTMNSLVVWFVGLCVLVSAVWYLPRLLLTLLALPVFMPLALRGRLAEVLPTVYPRWPFGLAATLVAFLGSFIAWYEPIPGKEIGPLMPVLRSNFWLTIHVLTIVSSYAAGALAWGLGNLTLAWYLFGKYRAPVANVAENSAGSLATSATDGGQRMVANRPPAECAALAGYCYKAMQVAVLLLAAGTILGGLWADVSWGRFWGWDPKEVFALVSLLIYLAVLHGRYAGWFGNFGLAVGTILGASAIIMSWYGVNFILGVGLHAYGFGSGGQLQVGIAVFLNWLFLGLAALRYWAETQPRSAGPPANAAARVEEGATA